MWEGILFPWAGAGADQVELLRLAEKSFLLFFSQYREILENSNMSSVTL